MLLSLRRHLNFYRIHILFFTFTPLIFSAIFFASNGRYKIKYIDALFNCVSAMTVCGLATVDLSSLTPWQQVILFIQMCLGSPVFVSWVMVYIRKYYFEKKFERLIEAVAAKNKVTLPKERGNLLVRWSCSIVTLFKGRKGHGLPMASTSGEKGRKTPAKLRADMIRRMDNAPQFVNPSGWISEGDRIPIGTVGSQSQAAFQQIPSPESETPTGEEPGIILRRLSDPSGDAFPQGQPNSKVEFTTLPRRRTRMEPQREDHSPIRPTAEPLQIDDRQFIRRMSVNSHSLMNVPTYSSHKSTPGAMHKDFGGFPMPYEVIHKLIDRFFPKLKRKLTRTITMPMSTTLASQRGAHIPPGAKAVPYISFEAVVGRNSAFPLLSDEQMEELGGVEYRALNALLWIVAGYHIGAQLISFIVVASYMTLPKWDDDLLPPALFRPVSSTWYSLFQMVSAYTNTGTSLVDQSMVPFQTAYPVIVFVILMILAGNTAFPIFLRAIIYLLSKVVPRTSRLNETLNFLLDHPRRCFIYMFPSQQTWFLLVVVITLNLTDWLSFIILDIGNPAIEDIPVGTRLIVGLLQGVAVRAAGFGIVPLAALAPAVKVLYIYMMYISVYPIAMSVRSTNVYEEQSLGVFRDPENMDENEFQPGARITVWSKYLAMHARKQLSFDMWWLALSLFLICIIERPNLDDTSKATWFNVFNIIFEITSAYGTVGLSLGLPTENYSLSGAFRPLSKLILCFVMLRGRHRGLPVAIDRAVMLPGDFKLHDEIDAETTSQYFSHRANTFQRSEEPEQNHTEDAQPTVLQGGHQEADNR